MDLSKTKLADLGTMSGIGVSPVAVAELASGKLINDRYEIVRIIGQGGMGVVYEATDQLRGTSVALKFLRHELVASDTAIQRFLNEARIATDLAHENIVRVYDVSKYDNSYFLSMELLQGQSLRELLRETASTKQQLPVVQALAIARDIAEGLAYAHRSTIHRDIKPENIWILPDGKAKLMDFGIARLQSQTQGLTKTAAVLGTAYYMAPEQLVGSGEIDHRADQYSLGVVLYEMLTGNLPIGRVDSVSKIRREVPRAISELVAKALSGRPSERFSNDADWVKALAIGLSETFPKKVLRKGVVYSIGGLGLAAAVVAGVHFSTLQRPPATIPIPTVAQEMPSIKVAFAYVGPTGDGGWTFAHDQARKALEKEFGDKIATSSVENVPESADAERVFRDMASQGNKLIFGTTFGYMEPLLKVAADFPEVKFEHATGFKTTKNMRTYDSRTYEGAYMAGVIAGKMTKTNTIGVVGSIPIPEVIRNINAFTLGAQSTNPKIKTKVVWVNEWFNPPKETEAATSLINGGADVLMQNTDSSAVLQTAEKLGKRGFGWDSDMKAYAPKAHLGSAAINWAPYYIQATKDALEGKWTTGKAWWGVKEGAIDMVSVAEDVPEDVKKKVDEVKAGLKDGSFTIWKGPITDNTGKVQVAKDAVADDAFLGGINFFVKGVEGKVPGGKK